MRVCKNARYFMHIILSSNWHHLFCIFLTSGDIILELNGRHIRNFDTANKTLDNRYGKVTVALVPVETKNQNRIQEKLAYQGSRVRRARNLFAKVKFYK